MTILSTLNKKLVSYMQQSNTKREIIIKIPHSHYFISMSKSAL